MQKIFSSIKFRCEKQITIEYFCDFAKRKNHRQNQLSKTKKSTRYTRLREFKVVKPTKPDQ